MTTGERIKFYRDELGLSQAELAGYTKLSLRTIQRIENGQSSARGHSLRMIADALKVSISELNSEKVQFSQEIDKIKKMNTLALVGLLLPFGSLMLPYFYWRKHRSNGEFNRTARRVLNFQILWLVATSLFLLSAPLFVKILKTSFPLVLLVWIVAFVVNALSILKASKALNSGNTDIYKTGFYLL